ncbi:MAG TPA: molybdenum cofactor biosynthesis protein MoaE [Stellaceae bacterium]|nr:molybdenum cofactor biosynthesis protein MoaE [Stellaceae bacterium]
MIRIATAAFDSGRELAEFIRLCPASTGGIASFTGLVRGGGTDGITALTLEHYPGMTERRIAEIIETAHARWQLDSSLVIHRVGRMLPGEAIVFVATASAHRAAALAACEFLIDWLKTKAPFWKLEETSAGERWVEPRAADDEAAARWA